MRYHDAQNDYQNDYSNAARRANWLLSRMTAAVLALVKNAHDGPNPVKKVASSLHQAFAYADIPAPTVWLLAKLDDVSLWHMRLSQQRR